MAKQLQIVGVQGVLIVTRCQGECPFNDECIECKLSSEVDVQLTDLAIPKGCPLPEVPPAAPAAPSDIWPTDATHRLGPNDERLIAQTEHKSCFGCFYHGKRCRDIECYEKIWILEGAENEQ